MSSIKVVAAEACNSEEFAKCLKGQNHDDDILSLTPTKRSCSDVHARMCSNFNEMKNCVENFANRCIPSIIRDMFLQKYAGTWKFNHELCRDGEFKEQFILHASCFKIAWKKETSCNDLLEELKNSFVHLNGLTFIGPNDRNEAVEKHCW